MSNVLYGDNTFEVTYEFQEDNAFVHLEVKTWNKSALKRMQYVFELIRLRFGEEGHPVLFATTEDPKAMKLWSLIKPWDEIKELKRGALHVGWLGAWYTE